MDFAEEERANTKKMERDLIKEYGDEEQSCNPDLPTLSVGDIFIDNDTDFASVKKEYKAFILSVSDSTCEGKG